MVYDMRRGFIPSPRKAWQIAIAFPFKQILESIKKLHGITRCVQMGNSSGREAAGSTEPVSSSLKGQAHCSHLLHHLPRKASMEGDNVLKPSPILPSQQKANLPLPCSWAHTSGRGTEEMRSSCLTVTFEKVAVQACRLGYKREAKPQAVNQTPVLLVSIEGQFENVQVCWWLGRHQAGEEQRNYSQAEHSSLLQPLHFASCLGVGAPDLWHLSVLPHPPLANFKQASMRHFLERCTEGSFSFQLQ